ncbi:MAG: ankyrin repeat domain-containing protein [Gammaproteobacteria bacterium]|nr:ankyrin repeat domain-containing protein [Gammaproteobacteria bacterium]
MTFSEEFRPLVEHLTLQLLTIAVEKRVTITEGFTFANNILGVDAKKTLQKLEQLRNDIDNQGFTLPEDKEGLDVRLEEIKTLLNLSKMRHKVNQTTLKSITLKYIINNFSLFDSRVHLLPLDLQELITVNQNSSEVQGQLIPEVKIKINSILQDHLKYLFTLLLNPNPGIRLIDILLVSACITGDMEVVRRLVDLGANINIKLSGILRDVIPLHLASIYGHSEIVTLLLECDVNVNTQDRHGNTPMHMAIICWQYSVIRNLMSAKNINLELHNLNHHTPLIMAANENNCTMVKLLLKSPQQRNQARTLLSLKWLSRNDAWDILCLLHKENTSIPKEKNESDDKFSSLHHAIMNNNANMVKYIVRLPQVNCDEKNYIGQTPLALAIDIKADNEIVTVLANLTQENFAFERLNLFEHAILSKNYELLRVIENRAPELLPPQPHKYKNNKINYIALLQTKIAEFHECDKIWGNQIDKDLKEAVRALLYYLQGTKNNDKWFAKLCRQALTLLESSFPEYINKLTVLHKIVTDNLPRGELKKEAEAFSKVIQFAIYKCKLIEILIDIDSNTEEWPEIASLISPADLSIVEQERILAITASLQTKDNKIEDQEPSSNEDLNNNNRKM